MPGADVKLGTCELGANKVVGAKEDCVPMVADPNAKG
jgi:hypothetical protein